MNAQGEAITLKVKEAMPKDVGRALARMDPEDMKRLGVEAGDIVEVAGKRKAAAKAMPCYPAERNKGIVQIDGILRENAQTGLDEKIEIRKAAAQAARRITLSPMTKIHPLHKLKDMKYLGSLLEGLPLTEGDRLRVSFFGARAYDFRAEGVLPAGIVYVTSATAINLETAKPAEKPKHVKVSYEDIGGLQPQIRKIREMIELPLRYPQIFERLGIEPPKGVFLYGPPGTGKTLIARAVANETEAYFTHLSGPEIMGKFYGESEARLRGIFEEAEKNAPAIIFIDEIDAIAPKREEMGGEKQVERRVVAQLLALMDGLESRGDVIVIAATNLPNMVDPALRRPGRFDREIPIDIPDRKGRYEIMDIHTRGMPLAEDVDLNRLAEITHGFVGADLEALARESAMSALRKLLPEIDFRMEEIPYETLMRLQVKMDDFMEAMKDVEPSAIREVFVEVPDVRWSDIGGLDDIKQELQEAIEWPLKYPELFEKAGTRPPKGILLHGPPGTGKTLIAKALATESGVNFIPVKGPGLISKYVGESERAIRETFKKAKQASPSILFFDEIDSLVPRREDGGETRVTERVVSQFLTEMDGIEELRGVVVLAATNRPDLIDPALLRGGRFDVQMSLPLPDEKTRLRILEIHTSGRPLAPDVDLAALAGRTAGMAGADIELVCRRASLLSMREFISSGGGMKNSEELRVSARHFEEALKLLEKRVAEY